MTLRAIRRTAAALMLLGATVAFAPAQANLRGVREVRFVSLGDTTRVVVELTGSVKYKMDRIVGPDRLFFDLEQTEPRLTGNRSSLQLMVGDQTLKRIRLAENQPGTTRLVFDIESPDVVYKVTSLEAPNRLIIEFSRTAANRMVLTPAKELLADAAPEPARVIAEEKIELPRRVFSPPARKSADAGRRPVVLTNEIQLPSTAGAVPKTAVTMVALNRLAPAPLPPPKPQPSRLADPEKLIAALPPPPPVKRPPDSGRKDNYAVEPPSPGRAKADSSMIRQLGLQIGRIVIDPGHGGTDFGTTGPGGLHEKDLVLDIALRLGEMLEKQLNAEVIYTRKDDSHVSSERRTQIANELKADLFLSIHANSAPQSYVSGIETFYLSFANSPGAQEVAARENATSGRNIHELQSLLEKIALNTKLSESREFASRVQLAMLQTAAPGPYRDRGVKRAPFIVLIGAQMPAILTEVAFLSNPKEEARLKKPETRQKIAEALLQGIVSYAGTLKAPASQVAAAGGSSALDE